VLEVLLARSPEWTFVLEFNFQVQRRPEGPLANSHAREGVEQAIKLIPRSEGPADD